MKFGLYSQVKDPNNSRVYADVLDEFREQVVYCEEAGFDIAWADEHHFNVEYTNSPNPIVAGAMLASHTSRIRIGLPVIVPFWHPLRLAEDVAVLDHMSRGRVEVALGRGNNSNTIANLNPQLQGLWPDRSLAYEKDPQATAREHFAEVVEILRKAWTEDYFSHEGRNYKFPQPGLPWGQQAPPRDATAEKDGEILKMCLGPKPYQSPHPPLRMLANSEPSFRQAAELGLKAWVWINPPKRLRRFLQLYSEIRTEREGRPLRAGEDVTALRFVYVAGSYEEAKRDAGEFFTTYVTRSSEGRPPSYFVDDGEDESAHVDMSWEFWRKKLMILAGTPEQVAEQIHELDETCNIDTIALWTQAAYLRAGTEILSHKKTMSSLELFATKVAPLFADAKSESPKKVGVPQE